MPPLPPDQLIFPASQAALLEPYLPPLHPQNANPVNKPFTTLTYAHSLDASIATLPGVRTTLSGPQSKAMTHYLRTRHDAILIGAGTAVADDPGLNSRVYVHPTSSSPSTAAEVGVGGGGEPPLTSQPRPIILDPRGRWEFTAESKVIRLAAAGRGHGPWVVVAPGTVVEEGRREVLEEVGGRVIRLATGQNQDQDRFGWKDVLGMLGGEGIRSVMIEGGGEVINSLLAGGGDEEEDEGLVDAVIVTIAPTWFGQGGVVVSPPKLKGGEALRLRDVRWCPLGEDVVLCGRIAR
ncbi:dihydrofolate reductase-like domain-containing protein [Dichotomopilus funicola]|uniref:2,5-diamino-6-ribosylamino-4(3H)-pyrimidinone 5'-phosphate reductase n=1 Tax=Dichotomopilus funicola TaxID=1934379 RepID=A0AAN6V980_9PEZI|nr:dihydrofolate reductase-like domain-containing protein [Dichotomopilus funicola]